MAARKTNSSKRIKKVVVKTEEEILNAERKWPCIRMAMHAIQMATDRCYEGCKCKLHKAIDLVYEANSELIDEFLQ